MPYSQLNLWMSNAIFLALNESLLMHEVTRQGQNQEML